MSPLWSDMALARAALAKVEERDSFTDLALLKRPRFDNAKPAKRPVRRLLRTRFSSFAL